MKGLFLNGLYMAFGNIKLFLCVVIVSGAALLISGSPTAQELFVYITITALSLNGIPVMRKEAVSKWRKYEITMPVRRKDIVRCKFLNYLFWVAVGIVLAAVVTAAAALLHGGLGASEQQAQGFASMFALGTGISVLTCAIFYPLAYLFGAEKSETILVISLIGAIGLAILILELLNRFGSLTFALRLVIFVAFYVLMFIASYLATLGIYVRKDF